MSTRTLLGTAKVYRGKNGKLMVDTDSMRRSGFDGDDESGDDESGDDESGDDESGDDESGDDDTGDVNGDDESGDVDGDDDTGARRPRNKGKGKKKVKKNMYTKFCTVSAFGVSAAIIAINGGTEAETLTLTPTVTVKLSNLRMTFIPPSPVVAGSSPFFSVTQVRVGDELIWNDNGGVDAVYFSGDATLRGVLNGWYASPAQPVFIAGNYVNAGSVATATICRINATCVAFKKNRRRC